MKNNNFDYTDFIESIEYLKSKYSRTDFLVDFSERISEDYFKKLDEEDEITLDRAFFDYLMQYSDAIYSLTQHEDKEQMKIPILNLISTYIELFLKNLIMEVDEYSLTIKDLKIGHHNLKSIIESNLLSYWAVEFKVLNKVLYDLLKKEVMYFHGISESLGNLSVNTRFPIRKDSNNLNDLYKNISLGEVIDHWYSVKSISLIISEYRFLQSVKDYNFIVEKVEKIFGTNSRRQLTQKKKIIKRGCKEMKS